ncbi:MAG: trypsin-like peptidase domain-containing protein [Syntrophobacteraceae bacterium]|jgi:putative serine protease PepD
MHWKLPFSAKGPRVAISILLVFTAAAYSKAWALTAEEITTIQAYEKAAPSVVNITTRICEAEFFFCATPSVTGSGSGVVLREDGLIITNSHVVSGAQNILVVLSDGRRLEAAITAADPNDDLAVIKVDVGDKPLKAIVLGDSDKLKVGERVLAVGNPFGLGQTLTSGIVSMTGRTIRDDSKVLKNLVQTDAPINPGNSGGALINLDGELVGICTAILSPTGSSIRIGFALPVNRVKAVAPALMRPWPRITGWVLAILLVAWLLRRIYRKQSRRYYME